MAREKTYKTERALQAKVEEYFSSISRTVPLLEADGQTIKNDAGEDILRTEYLRPPTVSGLCLFLNITRRTWENYQKDAELHSITEIARAKMEAYLEEELLSRRKGIQGVIFNLQNNYGWREKKEIELGQETRNAAENMSVTEKMAYIEKVAKAYADKKTESI